MNTASQRVKKLFVTNPMRMEIARFKARFVRCTDSPVFNKALVALVAVCYLCILGLVFAVREDTQPVAVLACQMLATFLVVIAAAHGAIAGEKDRRSWDLLQVAPITQAEIVVGKFMGVLAVIGATALTFLPMVMIGLLFYSHGNRSSLYDVLVGEAIIVSSASAIAAFTIYLSSRLRNATTTLGAAIASVIGILVVLPLGGAALTSGWVSSQVADILLAWHPVWALVRVLILDNTGFLPLMRLLYGWPNVLAYSALALLFLSMTNARLKRRAKE